MLQQKRTTSVRQWRLILLIVAASQMCRADVFISAPTPAGPVGNPADVRTISPFLIKQVGLSSIRYQQVYDASLFSSVPSEYIYVTSLAFFLDAQTNRVYGWKINSMQLSLSTTQRTADNLSTNFADNVGQDQLIFFGPSQHDFLGIGGGGQLLIVLDKPFRYGSVMGNLLLDIQVFDGSGPIDVNNPALDAQDSETDEVSIVSATNVTATVGSLATTGLRTRIQFSAVPSLQIQVESVIGTNRPVLRWPAQPSVFVPQTSPQLGMNTSWQTITNGILGSPEGPDRVIYLPVPPSGTSGFYRLIWDSGQPVQAGTVPTLPGKSHESFITK